MYERRWDGVDNPQFDIRTSDLLAAWREAERILRSAIPDTPDYQLALRVATDACELYGERFEQIKSAGR